MPRRSPAYASKHETDSPQPSSTRGCARSARFAFVRLAAAISAQIGDPMRILHVSGQKPDSTGSGIYLTQVVAACARLGCEQAVVCGIGPDDAPVLPEGVAVYPVRFESNELPFPVVGMSDVMPYRATRYRDMTPEMVAQFRAAFECRLREAVCALEPDVIFCHHLYLLTSWVRELFPDLAVAALSHSSDLRQMRQHALEHDRIVAGIQGLDLVFGLHEGMRDTIADIYGMSRERVRVLGTGYDAGVFCHEGACALPMGEGRPPRILYAGKIAYAKGVASLMRSLALLPPELASVEIYLAGGAGDAQEYAAIEALATASGHKVVFLGKVSPSELASYYRACDVFVLPSFYEGLPLVVVEAMACGCKVVVSDLPGVRPWLGENLPAASVRYVELPRMEEVDVPFAADLPAFEQRLADELAASLAEPARGCDPCNLSWDGLARRLLDEFRTVLGRLQRLGRAA